MSISLKQISAEDVEQRQLSAHGGAMAPKFLLAERLRREVRAWGSRARHLVLGEVLRSQDKISRKECEEVLEQLVKTGDLLEGKGAILFPGPLRVVALPAGGWVMLGAVGNREAERGLGENSLQQGIFRKISGAIGAATVEAFCSSHQGAMLSLGDWSGLSEAPSVAEHLESLEARLAYASEGELVDVTSWSDLQKLSPEGLWRSSGEHTEHRLLRGRQSGYPVYGWAMAGGGGKALRLSADDARRAMFGWCSAQGNPARVQIAKEPELRVRVSWPFLLPRAEYRALWMLQIHEENTSKGALLDEVNWLWLKASLVEKLKCVEEPITP